MDIIRQDRAAHGGSRSGEHGHCDVTVTSLAQTPDSRLLPHWFSVVDLDIKLVKQASNDTVVLCHDTKRNIKATSFCNQGFVRVI